VKTSSKSTANLVLIPVPISGKGDAEQFPAPTILNAIVGIRKFVVENVRTARRMLRSMGYTANFDEEVELVELNKRNYLEALQQAKSWFGNGETVGLMSEAGCPGIADPGAEIVRIAQAAGVRVHPLVGPTSIVLTLMASGLNGQNFAFLGYAPIESKPLAEFFAEISSGVQRKKRTYLFMDTPYRNGKLFDAILDKCPPDFHCCVARDIHGDKELILTKLISEWKKGGKPDLHKIPTMFAVGTPQSELF